MLYIPLIAEQFFWARTYEHFTRAPFLYVNDHHEDADIDHAIGLTNTSRVQKHLQAVSRAMLNSRVEQTFLAIATNLVQ